VSQVAASVLTRKVRLIFGLAAINNKVGDATGRIWIRNAQGRQQMPDLIIDIGAGRNL
jgi:hypothetical protein